MILKVLLKNIVNQRLFLLLRTTAVGSWLTVKSPSVYGLNEKITMSILMLLYFDIAVVVVDL